jgi:hypothetical protein
MDGWLDGRKDVRKKGKNEGRKAERKEGWKEGRKEGRKGGSGRITIIGRTNEMGGKEIWDIRWKALKVWQFIREFVFNFQRELH